METFNEYTDALAQYFTSVFCGIAHILFGGDADIDDIEFYR